MIQIHHPILHLALALVGRCLTLPRLHPLVTARQDLLHPGLRRSQRPLECLICTAVGRPTDIHGSVHAHEAKMESVQVLTGFITLLFGARIGMFDVFSHDGEDFVPQRYTYQSYFATILDIFLQFYILFLQSLEYIIYILYLCTIDMALSRQLVDSWTPLGRRRSALCRSRQRR